jgi:peptidoglycan-N-acetylglucosamine deacetylase
MGLDRRTLLGRVATGATAAVAGGWSVRATDRPRPATVPPSSVAAAALRGQAGIWWSAPTSEPDLALTFDDGPTPTFTVAVLDLLARFDVRATFFVIGAQVERNPDLVRRAWVAGHEIANHSYDHVRASRATGRAIAESMTRGADAVERVTGQRPRWFRPPRGEVTSGVVRAAAQSGNDIGLWSIDRGSAADEDAAGVARHLVASAHPGAVVLLHDGIGRSGFVGRPDAGLTARRAAEMKALPEVLTAWLAAGYRLRRLSELIPDHKPSND